MVLKGTHDKQDEIPEHFRELYTEKNGKWECTGIQGMKTQSDVDRIQEAQRKATTDREVIKSKLVLFGDGKVGVDSSLDDWKALHEGLVTKLDRIPELEAASKGKLDEVEIEAIVARRVDGTIRSKLAGPERKVKELEKANGELTDENGKFRAADRTRMIHDDVRKALVASKVLNDAHEDALMLADHVFEVREDDKKVVTRDNIGITPGLDAAGWLTEIQDRRRHWWPESVGGGSRGSGPGAGVAGGKNPWTHENWSMTEQGQIFKVHGRDRCDQLAKAAGTEFGGARPRPKKPATA